MGPNQVTAGEQTVLLWRPQQIMDHATAARLIEALFRALPHRWRRWVIDRLSRALVGEEVG